MRTWVLDGTIQQKAHCMLHAGLDLSSQGLDLHVLDEGGRTVEATAVRPDAETLRTLVARISGHGREVSVVIESTNATRFVQDALELGGWGVAIADALRVKGLRPVAANGPS